MRTSKNHEKSPILPRRKDIWLFPYATIKHNSRLDWRLQLILGLVALVFGSVSLIFLIQQAMHGDFEFVPTLLAICAVLAGVLYVPAAIIYFARRRRGEPTDFFDYEVTAHGQHTTRDEGATHAPDHH